MKVRSAGLLSLIFLATGTGWAGTSVGNGGGFAVKQFRATGSRLAAEIVNRNIRKFFGYPASEFQSFVEKLDVACVDTPLYLQQGGAKVHVDAINYPAASRIVFHCPAWDARSPEERRELVLHETLSILVGKGLLSREMLAESGFLESRYQISALLLSMLSEERTYVPRDLGARIRMTIQDSGGGALVAVRIESERAGLSFREALQEREVIFGPSVEKYFERALPVKISLDQFHDGQYVPFPGSDRVVYLAGSASEGWVEVLLQRSELRAPRATISGDAQVVLRACANGSVFSPKTAWCDQATFWVKTEVSPEPALPSQGGAHDTGKESPTEPQGRRVFTGGPTNERTCRAAIGQAKQDAMNRCKEVFDFQHCWPEPDNTIEVTPVAGGYCQAVAKCVGIP